MVVWELKNISICSSKSEFYSLKKIDVRSQNLTRMTAESIELISAKHSMPFKLMILQLSTQLNGNNISSTKIILPPPIIGTTGGVPKSSAKFMAETSGNKT